MEQFRKLSIEIYRPPDAGGLQAKAVATFDGMAPLQVDVELDDDNHASVRFSDGPYTTHQLLNVADSVLAAMRRLDALS
jgi:hypothetical protein